MASFLSSLFGGSSSGNGSEGSSKPNAGEYLHISPMNGDDDDVLDSGESDEQEFEMTTLPKSRFDNDVLTHTAAADDSFHDEWDKDEHTSQAGAHQRILQVWIITFLVTLVLLGWIGFWVHLVGRLWPAWLVVAHLHLQWVACLRVTATAYSSSQSWCSWITLARVMDVLLFGVLYPYLGEILISIFYRDLDGTIVPEWKTTVILLHFLEGSGLLLVGLQCVWGRCQNCNRHGRSEACYQWCYDHLLEMDTSQIKQVPSAVDDEYDDQDEAEFGYLPKSTTSTVIQYRPKKSVQLCLRICFWMVVLLHIVSILSLASHFGPWPDSLLVPQFFGGDKTFECDPLDETECSFPFPSFHHLREDPTTVTGYRVQLQGLPPLRGGIHLRPDFLNELDGFSTMAPILFYLNGMKEGHELRRKQQSRTSSNDKPADQFRLAGPEDIAHSTTPYSITLLLNVDKNELVPHSAEIDYLDRDRPSVMIIPAAPLDHATHYAVVVHHAFDGSGESLPATPGLQTIFSQSSIQSHYAGQQTRFRNKVLPALLQTAEKQWSDKFFGFSLSQHPEMLLSKPGPSSPGTSGGGGDFQLQQMFDFVTVSAESQLGPIRNVRDRMVQSLDAFDWDWSSHFQVVKEERFSCENENYPVARSIHVQIEVPSFLKNPYSRYSFLDPDSFAKSTLPLGSAKAIIQIPCSLERAIQGAKNSQPVRTIVEFGHSLFSNREEIRGGFLARMADQHGFLLCALEWRGMSTFDFPVVIRTLVGDLKWFQAIRDGLIQGYANKLAFHHLVQHGLFDLLTLDGKRIPTQFNQLPVSTFYGISQGGILGGGYLALLGKTELIERGVLSVPGTTFASVMTRSLAFSDYDQPMLLNLYNNRHVRLILSLAQMAWDSVEVSGLLAQPMPPEEILPDVLMQAGLGDAIVPTSAAEAMTRAMGGVVLDSNPHVPFGIPTAPAGDQFTKGPHVTLSELLYKTEYDALPEDNLGNPPENWRVHDCVRKDSEMQAQLVEFMLSGTVTDPCLDTGCIREHAYC